MKDLTFGMQLDGGKTSENITNPELFAATKTKGQVGADSPK
jgi:hypothetical protein